MIGLLRVLFYTVFVRLLVLVVLGLNVRRRDLLPKSGPAIIVANHNSHLDTMALISLLPLWLLPIVRPVAAMDYFLRSPPLGWFALKSSASCRLGEPGREAKIVRSRPALTRSRMEIS